MSLLHRTQSDHGDLPELTPAELAELDALDAALAGEPVDDPALGSLVREVKAAAPELGTDGAQRVKERLAGRFGPDGGRPDARRSRGWLRLPLGGPAAGLATVLVALVVVGGTIALVDGSGDDASVLSGVVEPAADVQESDTPLAAAPTSGEAATSQSSRAESAGAAPADEARSDSRAANPDAGGADRTTGRAVERSVDLSVRVKTGELQGAAAKVSSITRDANGYVSTSELQLGTGGAGTASFELRVESSALDRAIDRLSALGTVTSQQEASRDITSSLDSAKRRRDDARKERTALLGALAKAKAAGEIAALRARIAENRRQLASLDAQVQRVQRRAALTTIALTLDAPAKGDPAADDGSWGLGDAARDAWGALRAILGVLLVAAAVGAPFALLGGVAYAIAASRRRAARERALDA